MDRILAFTARVGARTASRYSHDADGGLRSPNQYAAHDPSQAMADIFEAISDRYVRQWCQIKHLEKTAPKVGDSAPAYLRKPRFGFVWLEAKNKG